MAEISGFFAISSCHQDTSVPLLQRNLVVRANSTNAPMEVSTMQLSVSHPGLTFKAYQSGHVVYRPNVMPPDIAYRELEESTHSAIAIPVAGEDGLPIAALYISSDEIDAFSMDDQRALRLIIENDRRIVLDLSSSSSCHGKAFGYDHKSWTGGCFISKFFV